MEVIKKITTNLTDKGVSARVYAMRGDSARKVKIYLYENAEPWVAPDGCTAYLSYIKPSGESERVLTLSDGSPVASIQENVVFLVIPPQSIDEVGTVTASIVLVSADQKQVTTFPFELLVTESGYDAGEADPFTPSEYAQMLSLIAQKMPRNLERGVDYGETLPENSRDGKLFFVEDPTQDYVVQQGRSDLWFWRKWNSGLAELWYLGKYHYTYTYVALPFPLTEEFGCFAKQLMKNDANEQGIDVTIYSPYTDLTSLYTKKQINGIVNNQGYLDTPIYVVGLWK